MADIADTEIVCQPGDPSLLADAADLGNVRLDNVEGPTGQPGQEGLAPREHLSAGDRHRAHAPQMAVVVDRVGPQGFLEPADVMIAQHLRRAQGPFQSVRPVAIAGARIHEKARVAATRLARGAPDRLVLLRVAPAERTPADFEGAEPALVVSRD